ncbi:MAG: hypothetical protein ACRDNK_05770 [Solirubrobacteraceae bacterium]
MATTAARPTQQKTKSAPAADKVKPPQSAGKSGRPRKPDKPNSGDGAPSKPGKSTRAMGTAVARRSSPSPIASTVARHALSVSTGRVSEAAQRGAQAGELALQLARQKAIEVTSTSVKVKTTQRPPIQAAVDVAVPSAVAFGEWMHLEWLPDGGNRVLDVEREGDRELTGRLQGGEGEGWRAEILDEREEESFAWESVQGSDCAGLITFHALSERLTRIELSLDVRPVSMAQAMALASRLADRRVMADLRRFKARLELINPDLYADSDDDDD